MTEEEGLKISEMVQATLTTLPDDSIVPIANEAEEKNYYLALADLLSKGGFYGSSSPKEYVGQACFNANPSRMTSISISGKEDSGVLGYAIQDLATTAGAFLCKGARAYGWSVLSELVTQGNGIKVEEALIGPTSSSLKGIKISFDGSTASDGRARTYETTPADYLSNLITVDESLGREIDEETGVITLYQNSSYEAVISPAMTYQKILTDAVLSHSQTQKASCDGYVCPLVLPSGYIHEIAIFSPHTIETHTVQLYFAIYGNTKDDIATAQRWYTTGPDGLEFSSTSHSLETPIKINTNYTFHWIIVICKANSTNNLVLGAKKVNIAGLGVGETVKNCGVGIINNPFAGFEDFPHLFSDLGDGNLTESMVMPFIQFNIRKGATSGNTSSSESSEGSED